MKSPPLAREALDILPSELWEGVFVHVAPATSLLAAARVCRLFNDLCIPVFLATHGKTVSDFFKPEIRLVERTGTLEALAIMVTNKDLPAEKMSCYLSRPKTRYAARLRRLSRITARCPALKELYISFEDDFYTAPRAAAIGLSAFVSSLAKDAGPMVILHPEDIWLCRPSRLVTPFGNNPLITPPPNAAPASWWLSVLPLSTLLFLLSVNLQLVEQSSAASRCSILTLNGGSIETLSDKWRPQLGNLFSTILRNAVFTRLRTLCISSDVHDPEALRRFLVIHPGLVRVEYAPPTRKLNIYDSKTKLRRPLVDPPLAHPGLVSLHTSNELGRLLPSFDLSLCPNLHIFEFQISPFLSHSAALAFLDDLRLIADQLDGTRAITLKLWIMNSRGFPLWNKRSYTSVFHPCAWVDTPEALTTAASLRGFSKVEIHINTLHTGHRILPWLAIFPQLQEVQLYFHWRYSYAGIWGYMSGHRHLNFGWNRRSHAEQKVLQVEMARVLAHVPRASVIIPLDKIVKTQEQWLPANGREFLVRRGEAWLAQFESTKDFFFFSASSSSQASAGLLSESLLSLKPSEGSFGGLIDASSSFDAGRWISASDSQDSFLLYVFASTLSGLATAGL
ncbi:hypothetical protein C8F01DRAFT_1230270 [Mycena amicta]|nr:hypothetical protein C8F01DRAFT_1230270 [Mycena amicta]